MNQEQSTSCVDELQVMFKGKDLCLLNVSIGPVQEFIEEARKVRDLWVGSDLLNSLSLRVIESVTGYYKGASRVILLPDLSGYQKIVNDSAMPFSTLPNRFLALVPEEDIPHLAGIMKKAVDQCWLTLSHNVCSAIKISAEKYANWCDLFPSQVFDHFQLYWVAYPVTHDELKNKYQLVFDAVQLLMEERKIVRAFRQQKGSSARKCPQCGHREVMGPEGITSNKEFWATILDATRTRYPLRLKKNESLCAVCLVKRFASEADLGAGTISLPYDSTSDISSAPFRKRISDQKDTEDAKGEINHFLAAVNSLRTILNKSSFADVGHIPGDWFYREAFDIRSLAREYGIEETILAATSQRAAECLEPLTKRFGEPAKYYALIMLDGDDMGRHMSSLDPDGQRGFSESLLRLGITIMPGIVKDWGGQPVYSGGDELLALGPLEGVSGVCRDLMEAFQSGTGKTCSIAVVLAHHQDSLRRGLEEVRSGLVRAKEAYGKDAVAISVMKSSGTAVRGGFKRTFPEDKPGEKIEFLDFLDDIVLHMTQDGCSFGASMLRDIAEILPDFYASDRNDRKSLSQEPFRAAASRIVNRRSPDPAGHQEDVPDIEKFIPRFISRLIVLSDPDGWGGLRGWKVEDPVESTQSALLIADFLARQVKRSAT